MLVLGASHGLSEKTAQRRFLSSDGRPVRVTRTAAWRIRKFWWPLAQRRPGPAALAMPLSLTCTSRSARSQLHLGRGTPTLLSDNQVDRAGVADGLPSSPRGRSVQAGWRSAAPTAGRRW